MTVHADAMADRLPTLYREGENVRALLDLLGLQLEILDEEGRSVQRRHWFDTARELAEAARLGGLLDIVAEDWQGLGEYRAWLHALRTARLAEGSVTRRALSTFVTLYAEACERTTHVDAVADLAPDEGWAREPVAVGHAFVEHPDHLRMAHFGTGLGVSPLHRETLVNGGLDATPLHLLLIGVGPEAEHVPVVANVTRGEALVFLGSVPPGSRLWIRAGDAGLEADLDGQDATGRMRLVSAVTPGAPWSPSPVASQAAPLTLAPGSNEIWFLPVAHFDQPGLDRVLLALASLDLTQGHYDESAFDRALFAQHPSISIQAAWAERTPATVRVDLDAATMVSSLGELEAALASRDQLEASLRRGISSLTAAGVSGDVRLRPLHSSQRQRDLLTLSLPMRQREAGATGIDRVPDVGGIFGVTDFDDSTYR